MNTPISHLAYADYIAIQESEANYVQRYLRSLSHKTDNFLAIGTPQIKLFGK